MKRLLLMLGISLVALAIYFGLAVFRETQVEGRTLRAAMGTGLAVVGFLAPIFVVAVIAQWREDHRNLSEAEGAPEPIVTTPKNPRAARIQAELATLRSELERLRNRRE